MNRLHLLEERLDNIERALKNKVFEAKQVGTIYHVCTLKAYLKYILPTDQLVASGKYYNYVYGGDNYVSFTRDKSFVLDSRDDDIILVQIVVDGDKLSEHYKVRPYNDFAFTKDGIRRTWDNPKNREMEECVKGPIKNLSKYVKEVRFDIAACHDLTKEKDLQLLFKNGNTLKHLVYSKFLRGRSANIGVQSGASMEEVLNAMEDWQSVERMQEMLFSYNLQKIKKAIADGADVNKKHDADGYPLVYYCEDDESTSIIKTLLKAGANPNVILDDGNPVLFYTIDNWCNNIAKLLIAAGANVNARDNKGMNSLMHAINAGNNNIIETLIKRKVDINAINDNGDTALIMASRDGNDKAVQMLLEHNANISIVNGAGKTAASVGNKLIKSLIDTYSA